jgi:hypothetical protein
MNSPQRSPLTNDEALHVTWTIIEDFDEIGGSSILSYGLEWDSGTSQATWTPLLGYASN